MGFMHMGIQYALEIPPFLSPETSGRAAAQKF